MKLNLYSKKSVESQTVKMVYFCRHGLAHVERALSIGPGFGGSGVCRLQLQGWRSRRPGVGLIYNSLKFPSEQNNKTLHEMNHTDSQDQRSHRGSKNRWAFQLPAPLKPKDDFRRAHSNLFQLIFRGWAERNRSWESTGDFVAIATGSLTKWASVK